MHYHSKRWYYKMPIETSPTEGLSLVGTAWSALLTTGLTVLGYFAKRRDDRIDANEEAITAQGKLHAALELKIAENYATKPTMMALFQTATDANEKAVARVEKRIDETNGTIIKQGEKIDKVIESIGSLQSNVMTELAKKT